MDDNKQEKKTLDCKHTRQYLKDKKRYCERCGEEVNMEGGENEKV
jgi:hypothetical protein